MASRVGLAVLLAATACSSLGAAAATPRSAMYVVRVDPRLCPSPMCGGYWVALANGARTRCLDGRRHRRCRVARAVTRSGAEVAVVDGALARGTLDPGHDDLGDLRVSAVYRPAGSAAASGGFYRVFDTGLRCVKAPCFSSKAVQVNGSTGTRVSGVDLSTATAAPRELALAEAAVATRAGVLARGRFVRGGDGGRVFRATRLYLRAPLPRA